MKGVILLLCIAGAISAVAGGLTGNWLLLAIGWLFAIVGAILVRFASRKE